MTCHDDAPWLRPLAAGERVLPAQAPRRLTLLHCALADVFASGTFTPRIPTTGGLVASGWDARERGGATFIANPTESETTGSVFPSIARLTLAPGEIFVWVHDLPIGPSERYLSAYAGLVKCDARFLAAHIRPDPFLGARVFVYGAPGTQRSVVLFGGGRAEEASIRFTDAPQVVEVAESQLVALPDSLADALYLPDTPQASLEPTALGSNWLLWPDGALERPREWPETEGRTDGWLFTTVRVPSPTGARLDGFSGPLRVNGAPTDPTDLSLPAGESTLLLHADTPLSEPPLLLPDGACYVMELTDWRGRDG